MSWRCLYKILWKIVLSFACVLCGHERSHVHHYDIICISVREIICIERDIFPVFRWYHSAIWEKPVFLVKGLCFKCSPLKDIWPMNKQFNCLCHQLRERGAPLVAAAGRRLDSEAVKGDRKYDEHGWTYENSLGDATPGTDSLFHYTHFPGLNLKLSLLPVKLVSSDGSVRLQDEILRIWNLDKRALR